MLFRSIDFLGINYYKRGVTRHDDRALPVRAAEVRQPGSLYTETGWEVYPPGLTETLLWVRERTGDLPLYITENGAPFNDAVDGNGQVGDPRRIAYLAEHLRATKAALEAGANVRGYFVWSLLDNFEWDSGYSIRFGLVFVDYATLARIPKSSAYWYRDVIRANAIPTEGKPAMTAAAD